MDLAGHVTGLVNAVTKGMADELEPYDLSPLDFDLLRFCMARGECSATELASVLPVDASRISRIVTRMVDMNLLVRRRLRDDRRIVMLRLSDRGAELTATLRQRIATIEAQLTQNIGEEEMGVFADVVSRIIANHEALQQSR